MAFTLKIVTPKGLYLEDKVDSLSIKLTSGYRTFLTGHIPLIGAVDYAPMHFVKNGKTEYFAVLGGAINVTKEETVLILNGIEAKKDIDLKRAQDSKKRAEDRLAKKDSEIDLKRAQASLMRAITRIKTYEE